MKLVLANILIRPYERILCLMESWISCLDLVIMLFSCHKRLHLFLHCNIVALYDTPRNRGSEIKKETFESSNFREFVEIMVITLYPIF